MKAFALSEENLFINGSTTHTATAISPATASETNWFERANSKLLEIVWNTIKSVWLQHMTFKLVTV